MRFLILFKSYFLLSITCFAQVTYYISSTGNDRNSGTSVLTPWKTIREIEHGNTYLLKRGDIFNFTIKNIHKRLTEDTIKISSYGKGNKPIISLYKSIIKKAWVSSGYNIWKVNLNNENSFSNSRALDDKNVGFIKVSNKIKGNKLNNFSLLNKQWDFYSDSSYIYMYSNINPALLDDNIQITINNNIIQLSDNMIISDLHLTGTGGHAICGSNVKNILIENVDIDEVGGSFLSGFKNGDTRYGNGIEFNIGAYNCIIKGCRVSNVYDAAYTLQASGSESYFRSVTFQENFANNNEQSFEFWVKGYKSGFVDCKFICNRCFNAGFGWSHDVRPDKDAGVHVLNYFWEVNNSGLIIYNNEFVRAQSGYILLPKMFSTGSVFNLDYNTIKLDLKTFLVALNSKYNISNYQDFISVSKLDIHSNFVLIYK